VIGVMGRTWRLVTLVAIGLALLVWIDPPERKTGAELARGPRAMRQVVRHARIVDVRMGQRRVRAERGAHGWTIEGGAAPPFVASALDDLLTLLGDVRAVDAFRTTRFAAFGLDPPAATIVVTTARGTHRLALGSLNTTSATVYARRDDHPRVLQLGTYLLSVLERIVDHETPDR
jgi:hypothetical protein